MSHFFKIGMYGYWVFVYLKDHIDGTYGCGDSVVAGFSASGLKFDDCPCSLLKLFNSIHFSPLVSYLPRRAHTELSSYVWHFLIGNGPNLLVLTSDCKVD